MVFVCNVENCIQDRNDHIMLLTFFFLEAVMSLQALFQLSQVDGIALSWSNTTGRNTASNHDTVFAMFCKWL